MTDDFRAGTSAPSALVRRLVAASVGVVLIAAFIAPLRNELRYAIFPQDEGLLLVEPSLVLHGAIANRTFESGYGANSLWAIAAAFKVAGQSMAVERSVGILYRLLLFGSLVTLAWRGRGPFAALVAGMTCVVLFMGMLSLAAFAWIAALSVAAFSFLVLDIALRKERKPSLLLIAGVGFGFAIGSRIDMTPAILLAIVALFVVRRESIRWLVPGLAVGLVPMAVAIIQAGIPAFVRGQITQPVFISGPARRLPLSTLTWQELVLLFLCVTVAIASLTVGIVKTRRNREAWSAALLLILGAFELGILPQAFQHADAAHLAYTSCFVLPAAVLLPVWRPGRRWGVYSFNVVPFVIGTVVLVLAWPVFGSIYRSAVDSSVPVNTVTNDGRSVYVDSISDQEHLTAVLRMIDARSHRGDRIFVGPLDLRTANYNDTFLYFLLPNLTPGTFYLEMNPGVANGRDSRLASELGQDRFLVLTNRYDDIYDPDSATRVGPDAPNQVVKTKFRKVGSWGPWTLYQRRTG